MKTKVKRTVSLLLLLGITTIPCGISFHGSAQVPSTPPPQPAAQPPALTREHTAYMAGYPDTTMQPARPVTRAEAATFIYRLLQAPESGTLPCTYHDVAKNDWFAEPVRALCRLGLISNSNTFRPNDAITRAEFVAILTKLTTEIDTDLHFSDVAADHWAANAISQAAALHWVNGYDDGTFRPESTLTRAEACAILNRITNRRGDANQAEALLTLGLYKDVTPDYWAATAIVEATVPHTTSFSLKNENWTSTTAENFIFTPGIHNINGLLYAINREGHLLTNQTVGAYTANANGVLMQTASQYAASVPYISQLDNLDAEMGCEPISALMGLQGKGFALSISPTDFLDHLPYADTNPADGFVGSPYYSDGRYSSIDPAPLAAYCNQRCGLPLCEDFSGATIEEVRHELLAGNFIVAYQTFWWKPVSYSDFSINGHTTTMVSNNHARLICGYDPARGYLVSDPYNYYNTGKTNQYWIASASFEYCWNQRQKGMVIR
ncbi:MAG: S-layer homology domain-containing protein [Peptococcaceae bacterium]|nr:S-layer homology domain-containing protein [Peptococcaceae bacterium]